MTTVPTVDFSLIEQQKENIVPLATGRSASQLVSLSSLTRTNLTSKLALEHKKFLSQLNAIRIYDATGAWEEGFDGLTREEVERLSEDPLDPHHQYVRFVNGNYPAGASAESQLVRLLEEATRTFVKDERYRNDPRYLRLWSMYAKNCESPEDCYRFLFAKGIGEKLALLYEEYAFVLEAAGRRQKADQIYQLGIARLATPLERLKKRYQSFTARMLVAPPLPNPPPDRVPSSSSASGTNAASRSILGAGSSTSRSGATSGKENGARLFDVFKDEVGAETPTEGQWDDLGTVKSRKRENTEEAVSWEGETLRTGAGPVKSMGMEVFRDEDAPLPATSTTHLLPAEVLSKSVRGPSELEALFRDPFKNYSDEDRKLLEIDPIETALAPSKKTTTTKRTTKSTSATTKKSTSSKTTLASKSTKPESSQPEGERASTTVCDLQAIYPSPGVEYSFEELKIMKTENKYMEKSLSWGGWEWTQRFDEEVARTRRTTYRIDKETGWPLLFDPETQEPLWEFIQPPPRNPSPSPAPPPPDQHLLDSPSRAALPSPSPSPAASPIRCTQNENLELSTLTPPPAQQQFRPVVEEEGDEEEEPPTLDKALLSPIQTQPQPPTVPSLAPQQVSSPTPAPNNFYVDPRRPPSPTMNTRQAQALVDDLFAKTLNYGSGSLDDDDDDDDEEPDTEDDEGEDEVPFWEPLPASQLDQQGGASQFTQDSNYEGEDSEIGAFVGFPQTQSQASQSMMERLGEEEAEEQRRIVPEPIILFRDPVENDENSGAGVSRPTGLFKPSRPVLGFKPERLFEVRRDESVTAGQEIEVIPSSQLDEWEENEAEVSFEEFEASLRHDSPEQPPKIDGFALGRRPMGANRWAPLIDHMTPIAERTYEYSDATTTTGSMTSRSRMDNTFPITAPVVEEDEDDEDEEGASSTDEGEDGDIGFVAFVAEEGDDDFSSTGTRTPSTESDTDDDGGQGRALIQIAPAELHFPSLNANVVVDGDAGIDNASSDWRDSTRKDGHFDDQSGPSSAIVSAVSNPQERSFDVSLNNSLPEGFSITGNQSGMTTGMVLSDTTNFAASPSDHTSPSTSSLPPCNPYDPKLISALLTSSSSTTPILQHPKVHDLTHSQADRLGHLQKVAKRREAIAAKAKGSASKDRTGVIEEVWELQLDDEVFSVREKLGEGAFGAVFRVATSSPVDPEISFDEDADESETSVAVKVERPTNLWEFFILDRLHSRLSPSLQRSVVGASRLYAFADESFLFLDFCDQGTLLDAVNKANEAGVAPPTGAASSGLEEIVAMFFVIELLRLLEGFHEAGFIHGDLKIDNCLIRLEEVPGGTKSWSTNYNPSGGLGWSYKGLKVIDFGRSIDMSLFPVGQLFVSDLETDEFDCIEMREGRPWSYEPDYFGVASIAFNVLFGRYIETKAIESEQEGRRFVINQNFKRYHQAELWSKLFDALLNPKLVRPDATLPITNELRQIRGEMEDWLGKNCDRNGKSLKGLIKKMEIYSMSR